MKTFWRVKDVVEYTGFSKSKVYRDWPAWERLYGLRVIRSRKPGARKTSVRIHGGDLKRMMENNEVIEC